MSEYSKRSICSSDDDFLVRSKEMVYFFTDRGYRLSSLEKDLQRVETISRHDVLRPSDQIDRTVNRVPLVLTYHPFNTKMKRFLLHNVRILSMKEQTQFVFPFVAYKRDVSLRNMLAHSTDHTSIEQPGSCACQRPRWNSAKYTQQHSTVFLMSNCKTYAKT